VKAADLVLHGGRVLTLDRASRVAEAITISGERILAVGPDAEVLLRWGQAVSGSAMNDLDRIVREFVIANRFSPMRTSSTPMVT
jgi:hypothetical protein